MSTNEKVEKSFVERVLDRIQGGDKGKVTRFHGKLKKKLDKQIKMNLEKIEKKEELLEDNAEDIQTALLEVDPARIGSSTDIDNYLGEYVTLLDDLDAKRAALVEEINVCKKTIDLRKRQLRAL